ncbi:hypothetical protein BYT27DRAFT_7203323 [Phlegmacium glaucopus]|nr:hypothetical protein BYT27DRAFT_7203323 [Phlegmacium glaucopus]
MSSELSWPDSRENTRLYSIANAILVTSISTQKFESDLGRPDGTHLVSFVCNHDATSHRVVCMDLQLSARLSRGTTIFYEYKYPMYASHFHQSQVRLAEQPAVGFCNGFGP